MKHIMWVLFALIIIGCTDGKQSQEDTIAVTIEPLRYITEQICGDDFKVVSLVPAGTSPESYEPTPSNLRLFEKAKMFVSIGLLDIEYTIIESSKRNKNLKVITLAENSDYLAGHRCSNPNHNHHHNHHHKELDPHIWSSPKEVRAMVKVIEENLISLKPTEKEKYQKNSNQFISKIDSLDNFIEKKFEGLNSPSFLIYHPALGYYCRDYNLHQIAVEEDGKESGAKRIKEIIAKNKKKKYVLYQREFQTSIIESICKEIGAEPIIIDPLNYEWLENMYSITEAVYRCVKEN